MRTSSAQLSQGFLQDGQSSAKLCQITPKNTIFEPDPKRNFLCACQCLVFYFVFVMIGNVRAMVMAVDQRFLRSWDKKVSSVG